MLPSRKPLTNNARGGNWTPRGQADKSWRWPAVWRSGVRVLILPNNHLSRDLFAAWINKGRPLIKGDHWFADGALETELAITFSSTVRYACMRLCVCVFGSECVHAERNMTSWLYTKSIHSQHMRVSRPDIRSLLCKHIRCQTRKRTGRHACSHAEGNYRVLLATSIQSLGKLLKIAYRFPERRRGGLWEGGERCAAQSLTRTRPCDRHFRPSSDRTCLGWKTSNPTTTYKHSNVGLVVKSVCVHVRTFIAMHVDICVQFKK